MEKYRNIIIGIVMIVIAIVVIVLLINVVRSIFRGPAGQTEQTQANQNYNLTEARTRGDEVRYIVRGVINSEEDHRQIRITIDENMRRIEIIKGYQNEVIKTQDLPNNRAAYDSLIAAINGAGFTERQQPRSDAEQSRVCPLGRHFIYQVAQGTSNEYYSWGTSCNRRDGTFSGNASTIQRLFQSQIPNYSEFTRGVRLN